jgi:AAA+ ATPase superfamily predicted ATPase
MFVNREDELKVLESEFVKKSATFTVIYGRRRVGKTALISEYIRNKKHIYLYATEGNLTQQLLGFTRQIQTFVDPRVAKHLSFDSFTEAFEFLSELKLDSKLILVIDEYQNLCKLEKSFSSSLQRVWDLYLSHSNLHLILCGSVVSMMHSEVLAYNAPLYGRRTTNIHLKALHFHYISTFVPNLNPEELMRVYASFGTIPKYLNEYESTKSFQENIVEKILDKNAYLYSEGNFLLKQEISDAGNYFAILESIAKGNTKVGAIASNLSKPSTFVTPYLQKLLELDIVIKEVPITETNSLKSKLGRYKIKDKFLNFWFFYVYKNYNYLEVKQIDAVLDELELNFNDRFVSFAFEDYVLEDMLLNYQKYFTFRPHKIGRWWNNKEEIDIVAFDEENICFIECKWQNSVNKERVKEALIEKSALVRSKKKSSFLIVSKEDYLNTNFEKPSPTSL